MNSCNRRKAKVGDFRILSRVIAVIRKLKAFDFGEVTGRSMRAFLFMESLQARSVQTYCRLSRHNTLLRQAIAHG